VNQSQIDRHLTDVPRLMKAVRHAIDHVASEYKKESEEKNVPLRATPTVIILTSGSTGMKSGAHEIEECIQRFNRITVDAAHSQGFPVLERGEIERRLMYRSLYADNPNLEPDMHLAQPSQNIIATALLQLINCLNGTKLAKANSFPVNPRKSKGMNPQHMPP